MQDAVQKGLSVYDMEVTFHPECGEKGVAARMVAQLLAGMGQIIHTSPDVESDEIDGAQKMTVVFATDRDGDSVRRGATIAGMTGAIVLREHQGTAYETRREKNDADNAAFARFRSDASGKRRSRTARGVILRGTSFSE